MKEAFDFPDHYGENLDALWNCLIDRVGRQNNVEIYGLSVLREKFDDTADKLIEILKRWKHYADDEYCDITRMNIREYSLSKGIRKPSRHKGLFSYHFSLKVIQKRCFE